MKVFKLAIWAFFTVIILVLFAALAGQNQDLIGVTLFSHTSESYPKWAVLIFCFLLGVLVTTLFFIIQLIVLETKNIRLRRQNSKLERNLSKYVPKSAKNDKTKTELDEPGVLSQVSAAATVTRASDEDDWSTKDIAHDDKDDV